jgi:hypothetical protein
MFNLEQSIAEWRKQMLAAGIKSPVPLEELESHLREEIEKQVQSGISEQLAFEAAIQHIGQAGPLKAEFRNAGFLNWWGEDNQTRINRFFALLWLAFCWWALLEMAVPFSTMFYETTPPFGGVTPGFFLMFIFVVIFLRGMGAGIRLFGGNNKEIRFLLLIAVLGLIAIVAQILTFRPVSSMDIALAIFNIASLCLMRSPSNRNPKTAVK